MSKQKIELTFGGQLHEFNCAANENPMVRLFIDTSPGPLALANRVTEQYRAGSVRNDGTRFTTRLTLPVPAIISGGTVAGYVPDAKAAGQNRAIVTVDISKYADLDQVTAFVDALQDYVASAEYRAMLISQLMC